MRKHAHLTRDSIHGGWVTFLGITAQQLEVCEKDTAFSTGGLGDFLAGVHKELC